LNNNNLKIENTKIDKINTQKIEKLENNFKLIDIKDDIYDNFCGKINIINLLKTLKLYKHTLITGSTGIGKTLSVKLIFDKKNYDIVYYKDENLLSFLNNNNNKSIKNKNKIIVIDNLEELDIKEINHIVKSFILNRNIFIILICNDEYINDKDLKIIKRYFYNIKFITPNIYEIFLFIKNMCFKNKIKLTDNKINELILYKQNDIRSIINETLFHKDNLNNIHVSKKNRKLNIFDSFNKITKKIELQEKINILAQNDYMDLMVHENYCNNKSEDIYTTSKTANHLSFYDSLNSKEIIDNYELKGYGILLFNDVNIKYQNIKFPSYLINENKRKRKYENIKEEYYNYKKKYLYSSLSLKEFIEYKIF
jgi:hypothetical protein